MKVPLRYVDQTKWLEKISIALNQHDDGKTSNTGEVTLTVSVTTTTVSDRRIGQDSVVLFSPTTLNATTENLYVSSRVAGTSFTITHANTATSDRTFKYIIVG